ncbi:hypothetical protein [Tsukamurella soli]
MTAGAPGVLVAHAARLLADPNAPKGPEFGKASPIGLAVIVILCAVTFLLIRSMNRHVRGLPESFDEPDAKGSDDVESPRPDVADVPIEQKTDGDGAGRGKIPPVT